MYCKCACEYFAGEGEIVFQILISQWSKLIEIKDVLKIPADATVIIQNESFTLSDFFCIWIRMEVRLERLRKNVIQRTNFANIFKQKLDERKGSVLKHPTMLCAIYLDPRLQEELNDNEIHIAKTTLANLHQRVIDLESKHVTNTGEEGSGKQNTSLEEYFAEKRRQKATENNACERTKFMQLLDSFRFSVNDADTRTVNENSIIHFWEMRKTSNKKLYDVARIIYAIPPSQATVERSFSTLSFVFNEKRGKLAQQTLEDILLIKLNKDIATSVNENDMEKLKTNLTPVSITAAPSVEPPTQNMNQTVTTRPRTIKSKSNLSTQQEQEPLRRQQQPERLPAAIERASSSTLQSFNNRPPKLAKSKLKNS